MNNQDRKMGNSRVTGRCGYIHRSQLEASVCAVLSNNPNVEVLQHEDHIYLTRARIGYIADFKCKLKLSNDLFWVEAKGYQNDRWPMKKKLWKFYGPGPLHIYKGTYMKPYLDEVVIPVALSPEDLDR